MMRPRSVRVWAALTVVITACLAHSFAASSAPKSPGRPEIVRHSQAASESSSVAVTVNVVNGIRERPVIPTSYSLAQNYPNPFNATTVIEYAVPKNGRVRLDVFSILGKHVSTLVDEVQSPGYHSYQWSGDAQSSGVFLYRMSSGPFQQTRRMVLLK